jgi:ABC-2 type transport system ATP-binding protein
MPIVQLQHVRKVYDTKVAVADLSFSIEPGTMFGLLGPNGSGKTSSIRMMIGITVPDSGSVSLFNEPFRRPLLRRVGYLPEERGLYKKMNVMDQLIFLGQLHSLSAATASKRAHLWCEKLNITEAIPKKTEDLSKGMQQKIQFISTLLHEPELIIMDEPFSGLDPVNAVLLMDTLVDLRREGRAILFSTHRMDQVEKLCDNIALIHGGNLVLSGSMREIKSSYPRNRVLINFEGGDAFLNHPSIESLKRYNGQVEIKLRPSTTLADDAQSLLAQAITHARVTRFEVMEPTLEDIFIEKVQETSAGTSGDPTAQTSRMTPDGDLLHA